MSRILSTRNLLRIGVMFGICVVAAVLVFVGSRALSIITQSEDAADVFNDAAILPDELRDRVTWLEDPSDLPRVMDPNTRERITSAWLRAWAQIPIVATTGDTSGLEVYFSGPALTAMHARAAEWAEQPVTQISHDLRIEFFSEDGQVVGLRSEASRFERTTPASLADPDALPLMLQTTEQFDAVLLLEDGNWRVRHLVRSGMQVQDVG